MNIDRVRLRGVGRSCGRYRGLPLGAVDASVVAVAERLGLTEITTIDRVGAENDVTVSDQPVRC